MKQPEVITFARASKEIAERRKQNLGQPLPFFMVGAGVSCPVIPTAFEMIQDCKRLIAERQSRKQREAPRRLRPEEEFSWYLQRAFPSKKSRWKYFSDLMKGVSLSEANRLLALALSNRAFGNVLVTTNFDDHVERALSVLGIHSGAIESPTQSDKLDTQGPFPQILYLHGKVVFPDLASTRGELRQRREWSGALAALLQDGCPLVVGYSGEVDDVFLQALRKRPGGRGGYWFCYDPDDLPRLKRLLSFDASIRIVSDVCKLPAAFVIKGLLKKAGVAVAGTPWSFPERAAQDEAAARTFISEATRVRLQELESSELVSLGSNLLKSSDQFEYKEGEKSDPDRTTAFTLALRLAETLLERDRVPSSHRVMHARALLASGKLLVFEGKHRDSLTYLDRVVTLYGTEPDPELAHRVVGARFYRAIVLKRLDQTEAALTDARECLATHSTFKQPEILYYTMMTACNLAGDLLEDGKPEALGEARRWLTWISSVPKGRDISAEAYYKSALVEFQLLKKLGKPRHALAPLERIVKDRKQIAKLGLETAADALEFRCHTLVELDEFSRADRELSRLGRLFGPDREIKLRERLARHQVRMVLMRRGVGSPLDETEERNLDGIVRICGEALSPDVRTLLAQGLYMLGQNHLERDNFDKVLSAAERLHNTLGTEPPDPKVRGIIVKTALLSCAALRAKIHQALVSGDPCAPILANTLIESAASPMNSEWPDGYFFTAYGLFLVGEVRQAKRKVIEGAKLVELKWRNEFVKENFAASERHTREPLANVEIEFRAWFEGVIVKVDPAAPLRKRRKRSDFTYRWAFSNKP
jgi:hypothetical protein